MDNNLSLGANIDAKKYPQKNGVIEGKVLDQKNRVLYLDLGIYGIGVVRGYEFLQARESIKDLKIGEVISGKILSLANEEGLMELSLREVNRERTWKVLTGIKESKDSVKVKVKEANHGGLLVEYAGLTGFLPVSQLSSSHYPKVENSDKEKILIELKKFVGQEIEAKILDVNSDENKLIFSEKLIQSDQNKDLMANYQVGDIVEGTITKLVDFGAFIQFGKPPVDGLIHISEFDYKLVSNPGEYVQEGQKVQAKIISTDNDRLALSLKALKSDPWEKIAERYAPLTKISGKIMKVLPIGLFIEIEPGVNGFCSSSEFANWDTVKSEITLGETKDFFIKSIDTTGRKMTLSLTDKPKAIKEEEKPKEEMAAPEVVSESTEEAIPEVTKEEEKA